MEDLQEIHEEATAPRSKESEAHGLDLSIPSKKLAEDNTRDIILTALKINNISYDTLNISKSKFNKLNKEQLIEALKGKINEPKEAEKEDKKKQEDFDYLGAILSLKGTLESSLKSGDYQKLDSEVMGVTLKAMQSDENIQQIDIKSSHITKIIIGLSVSYFISRLVGFENISNKINDIKNKILKREKVENEE